MVTEIHASLFQSPEDCESGGSNFGQGITLDIYDGAGVAGVTYYAPAGAVVARVMTLAYSSSSLT